MKVFRKEHLLFYVTTRGSEDDKAGGKRKIQHTDFDSG